jgi:hypothetical protein
MSNMGPVAYPELRVLGGEDLDRVSGGTKNVKTPKATVKAYDAVVTDAVVTMDEFPALHEV